MGINKFLVGFVLSVLACSPQWASSARTNRKPIVKANKTGSIASKGWSVLDSLSTPVQAVDALANMVTLITGASLRLNNPIITALLLGSSAWGLGRVLYRMVGDMKDRVKNALDPSLPLKKSTLWDRVGGELAIPSTVIGWNIIDGIFGGAISNGAILGSMYGAAFKTSAFTMGLTGLLEVARLIPLKHKTPLKQTQINENTQTTIKARVTRKKQKDSV